MLLTIESLVNQAFHLFKTRGIVDLSHNPQAISRQTSWPMLFVILSLFRPGLASLSFLLLLGRLSLFPTVLLLGYLCSFSFIFLFFRLLIFRVSSRYAVLGAGFAGISVAWHLLKVLLIASLWISRNLYFIFEKTLRVAPNSLWILLLDSTFCLCFRRTVQRIWD